MKENDYNSFWYWISIWFKNYFKSWLDGGGIISNDDDDDDDDDYDDDDDDGDSDGNILVNRVDHAT